MLPFTTFFASTDCCAVADGVWRCPSLALFQELQRHLPILTFLTSTDGCIVAGRVRPNPLIAHGLQESQRMLPFTTFFASTDGCAVANDVELHFHPVGFEYAQCLSPLSPSAMLCEGFAQLLIAKALAL